MRSRLMNATACALLVTLAACDRIAAPKSTPTTASAEFAWARAALERNATLEVIAADTQAGVFTVRVKRTGETQTIKLAELIATPASELGTATPAVAAVPAAPAPLPEQRPVAPAVPEPAAAPPAEAPALAATPAPLGNDKTYTIERNGGRLKVSGPGVSIVSAGPAGATVAQKEAGQRTVEPLICEGHRMLHFDNRSIYVDGDAIVARGGCEIYITNSHIVASGTAVVAEDSIVHVANSTLEGSAASFDAGNDARLYLRSSTFQGLPRRAEKAVVQDQGGNTWR